MATELRCLRFVAGLLAIIAIIISILSVVADWWSMTSITHSGGRRTETIGSRSLWVVTLEFHVEHPDGTKETTSTSHNVDDQCSESRDDQVKQDCTLNMLVRAFSILVEPCILVAAGCHFYAVFRPRIIVMYVGAGFSAAAAACAAIGYGVATTMDLGDNAAMDGTGAHSMIATVALAAGSAVFGVLSLNNEEDEDDEEADGPDNSRPPETPVAPSKVSRKEVMEYLDKRVWWGRGLRSIAFTLGFWCVFVALILLSLSHHNGLGFDVHTSLISHFKNLQAHRGVGGLTAVLPEEKAVPCRCVCRTGVLGMPPGACGQGGDGVLDFLGHPLPDDAISLLEYGETEGDPETQSVGALEWDDIVTLEDAWLWVEHGFLPDLDGRQATTVDGVHIGSDVAMHGRFLTWNIVIGGVRVRQHRAELEDCNVPDTIKGVYGSQCRSADPATSYPGAIAEEASFVTEKSPDEDGAFDAFFDVERPVSDAMEVAETLRKLPWWDGATKEIELQAALVNPQAGVYILLRLAFEVSRSGGVKKGIFIHTLPAGGNFGLATIVVVAIWVICILFLLIKELRQIRQMSKRGSCKVYLTDPANLLDWISVVVGLIMVILWTMVLGGTSGLASDIVAIPRAPIEESVVPAYRGSWTLVLDNLQDLEHMQRWLQIFIFWYTTLISLRFLKAFSGQSRLAVLAYSVVHLSWDIAYFLTVFLTAFINFSLGGHILFGADIWEWSSFGKAFGTTVRLMLGSFAFDEMYNVAPVSATIWFWLFLVGVVLILMNLFLAIIIENFLTSREQVGEGMSAVEEFREWLRDFAYTWQWGMDQEGWKGALRSDPFGPVYTEMAKLAGLHEELLHQAEQSCLGLKLGLQKMQDHKDIEEISNRDALEEATSMHELRQMGVDPFLADQILDETRRLAPGDQKEPSTKELLQDFVQALKRHHSFFDEICDGLEENCDSDQIDLAEAIDTLETDVLDSLKNFALIRVHGVQTYAATEPDRSVFTKVPETAEQMPVKMLDYHDVGHNPRKDMMRASTILTETAASPVTRTGKIRRKSSVASLARSETSSLARRRSVKITYAIADENESVTGALKRLASTGSAPRALQDVPASSTPALPAPQPAGDAKASQGRAQPP